MAKGFYRAASAAMSPILVGGLASLRANPWATALSAPAGTLETIDPAQLQKFFGLGFSGFILGGGLSALYLYISKSKKN